MNEGESVEEAFRHALSVIKGSYAIALVDNQDPDTIYVGKNKSPLLVGVGEGFNVVASDAMAMISQTDKYVELMDEEIVIVTRDSYTIKTLDGQEVSRDPYTAELDASDIEKGTYPHYMLKEIDGGRSLCVTSSSTTRTKTET